MKRFIASSRFLLTAAACTVTSSATQAQHVTPVLMAGLNSATMSTDQGKNTRRNAVVAGVSFEMPTTGVVGFQPELLYSQKGARTKEEGFSGGLDVSYVQVPLLARIGSHNGTGARPYLLAGPSVAVRVGCKATFAGEGVSASVDCTEAVDGETAMELNRVDLSGVIGVGLDFGPGASSGNRRFTTSVRYDHSFTDLAKDKDVGSNKHRVLSLVVGYRFARR